MNPFFEALKKCLRWSMQIFSLIIFLRVLVAPVVWVIMESLVKPGFASLMEKLAPVGEQFLAAGLNCEQALKDYLNNSSPIFLVVINMFAIANLPIVGGARPFLDGLSLLLRLIWTGIKKLGPVKTYLIFVLLIILQSKGFEETCYLPACLINYVVDVALQFMYGVFLVHDTIIEFIAFCLKYVFYKLKELLGDCLYYVYKSLS